MKIPILHFKKNAISVSFSGKFSEDLQILETAASVFTVPIYYELFFKCKLLDEKFFSPAVCHFYKTKLL